MIVEKKKMTDRKSGDSKSGPKNVTYQTKCLKIKSGFKQYRFLFFNKKKLQIINTVTFITYLNIMLQF